MAQACWQCGMSAWAYGREEGQARGLVAMEDEYFAYPEVIAAGAQTLHPDSEVTAIGLDLLVGELSRLDSEMVVCSRSGRLRTGSPGSSFP